MKLTATFLTVLICLTSSVVCGTEAGKAGWGKDPNRDGWLIRHDGSTKRDKWVKRNGLYYEKFSNTPYTGTMEIFHSRTGQLHQLYHIVRGKMHGPRKAEGWHFNARLVAFSQTHVIGSSDVLVHRAPL